MDGVERLTGRVVGQVVDRNQKARDLARSIVALRREVRWMKDGTPATPGLFETLSTIFNPIRK